MIVKLLTKNHLEFLSFNGGCTGSYESTLVKMSHCWKSHVMAQVNKIHLYNSTAAYLHMHNLLLLEVFLFTTICVVHAGIHSHEIN